MNGIILSAIFGVLMMFSSILTSNKATIRSLAIVLCALLLAGNIAEQSGWVLFHVNTSGMLHFSSYGLLFNSIAYFVTLLYFLLSARDIESVGINAAEYFALLFFILAGVAIVSSYDNLLMLFLGIEIISIPLYILTGSDKRNLKSNEAALKYFLMGSFSTGIMLMGITLMYGAKGTFALSGLTETVNPGRNAWYISGLLLLLISMAFKVSAAPFHFWTPDVYDGAPTVFTAFMATMVKAAVFIGFIRLFDTAFPASGQNWKLVLSVITAATLFIGNVTAIFQQSVKRMLAYSSIAQAGFMLFALYSYNDLSKEGLILYSLGYSLATVGIFAVLIRMKDYTFEGFNGLARTQPVLAATTTIFLLSLAGIPLTLGFFSKYYMLAAAVKNGGNLWLVFFAILCAVISVYYYFRVIQAMYFKTGQAEMEPVNAGFRWTLVGMAALVILLGIFPNLVLQYLYF
ncbi:NADH-quinone oxidoreductase subunit N [Flavihumibacter petaseus]|uniref:NADH-quinone oxidoreductase subunit N n=1 Tax=Flavihumibacter petaseus NBRC 106054 TaxID=1220578 RepID=A0A0E9MVP4_9BACT|nr:NADH-quinone oxidoreductase subunit N [Flavihumibacter petaseus]GAO41481.1 NADH--quinone oxidoreductase subunit N [Flavihumibacter petaseus NBRC 106054]